MWNAEIFIYGLYYLRKIPTVRTFQFENFLLLHIVKQGCHQIREFRENQGKKKGILKIQEHDGSFEFVIMSLRHGDFLHTQSRIQKSVVIAKFPPPV